MSRKFTSRFGAALTLVALTACADSTSSVEEPLQLAFSASQIDFQTGREAVVSVSNPGSRAVGPVDLIAGPVRDGGGTTVPGSRLVVNPASVPTLNPGASVDIQLTLEVPATVQGGMYDAALTARAPEVQASLDVRFEVETPSLPAGATIQIQSGPSTIVQGDVVPYVAEVRDSGGALIEGATVEWSVEPAAAGFFGSSGQFVAYRTGSFEVMASAGGMTDRLTVTARSRSTTGSFSVVGEGIESTRFTSDLWLHGDYAYTGTWGVRQSGGSAVAGNALFTWNISNPAAPRRTASLEIDARTLNDVKVRADGRIAVITHEGSNDGRNGVTVLDLGNAADPRVVSRFTTGLESGVHNVWVEGDYAYLVVDGVGSGMRVLDISDRDRPRLVAEFYAGESFLHDIYVRDGLAFLSHWNAGLVILDVGNGIAGGSPTNPVEVSRIFTDGGQAHNAWYWPEAGYVFVGEEDFGSPGIMHVVDLRNVRAPREVATFRVPGTTPHNFWLDEDRGILYLAWYTNGLRALDVSGELMGDLDRQGREIASARYNSVGTGCASPSGTCTWAPQIHRGLVYVSDLNSGLVVLNPGF